MLDAYAFTNQGKTPNCKLELEGGYRPKKGLPYPEADVQGLCSVTTVIYMEQALQEIIKNIAMYCISI